MGREEGRKAGVAHACKIMVEISREKVTAMRKMFAEISTVAGREAGVKAARVEVMKSVEQVVRLPEVANDDNAFQAMMDHVLEPMPP